MTTDTLKERNKSAKSARKTYASYHELKQEKAVCDAAMKAAKSGLLKFIKSNTDLLDDNKAIAMNDEGGKIRFASRNKVKHTKSFSIEKLMQVAPEMVNAEALIKYAIRTSHVNALQNTETGRKKLKQIGLKVEAVEEFVIE
ncbi:MAG: hypothetical protein RJQ09_21380 [Cyclobacteriaceae bacterium]